MKARSAGVPGAADDAGAEADAGPEGETDGAAD
jgi:hypothetical protein